MLKDMEKEMRRPRDTTEEEKAIKIAMPVIEKMLDDMPQFLKGHETSPGVIKLLGKAAEIQKILASA